MLPTLILFIGCDLPANTFTDPDGRDSPYTIVLPEVASGDFVSALCALRFSFLTLAS